MEKKDFFVPLASGLGATRRAAMLLLVMMLTTVTAWATDKTLSGSENYEAQNGDVLTGSTSGTVTIAADAKITLSDVTITGGIVCETSAEITLVGTNSVTGASNKAGIQVGGSGTKLTIKGNGSLTANGGYQSAGIGLSRAWNVTEDVIGGNIVIEGGTITANGGNWGSGIGIGTVKNTNNDNSTSVQFGNITIKGGSVTTIGGNSGEGIGKGYSYFGPTITIGTVTIYDAIEMVDASSIRDFANVVYMHDETDVTNSKTDYFTIGEDGDRRIITPKDETDYTITIANGIEHGSLTGAATAKYMEKVTITATPDLGYRLSHLVVKDADNNDVATTGNTFLMPKGNVTVSAVFEQGTHGTTEFAWGYSGLDGFVTEATIYDGVTTVELQQGQSYRILKYDEDSYRKFLLDNDIYNVTIPYSGGTGTFTNGNGTNFRVDYNGESGYYDITMTDVGNGKWSVSILKTVAVMDAVPDQTYTGSEIKPEPLVIAGSLNLTKGTDYEYSYTNNTNFGTAKVRATFQGTYASLGYVEKEFTILPPPVVVNVTGNGTVTYNDKVATNGEVIGVVADKGTDVTLTLAPESGYAVSIEYGYTNSSEMTMNGAKLPINGTTATLTVPNDLKDGTYVNLTVTFVSALVGGADEVSAVALTDNTLTDLAGGWYKVENDISFDHTLNLLGDTHLIIDDGKTMTVNTASGKAIDSEYTLNVSGEGALNITTTEAYKIAVRVGSYVQTGATVTANGYIGIRCTDDFVAFNFDNDFTFSGGQLTATGNSRGIWADNNITLSCTNATDFIQASSYESAHGAVKIADGKVLTDGTEASNGMNGYSGTLTNEQRTAIGGKTLHRAVTTSYVEASGTLHENVIAIPLDNTMTTLAAGWYVVNSNVTYTSGITTTGDVKLILGDGCTMSFGTKGEPLDGTIIECNDHDLTIYGQSGGTGWLKAYSTDGSGINTYNAYTQYSGNVLIFDGNGACIYASEFTILGGTLDLESQGGGADGEIVTTGNINIRGGKLWARYKGLKTMSGKIILGYTNATDEIYAHSYQPQNGLEIADGKTLVNDYGEIWSGTLNNYQIEQGINGRTLRPFKTITLADNADNSSTISEWNGGVANVTLSGRTLYKDGDWNTLCLPFDVTIAGSPLAGDNVVAKVLNTSSELAGGVLTLNFDDAPATISAGTPFIIMWNNTGVNLTNPVFEGVTTSNTTNNVAFTGGTFKGNYGPLEITDANRNDILLLAAGNKLGYAKTDRTIANGKAMGSCRAYFEIPSNGGGQAQARSFVLNFGNDNTTGIIEVSTNLTDITNKAEGIYDLQGRKVENPKKGLYIVNGKKILVP